MKKTFIFLLFFVSSSLFFAGHHFDSELAKKHPQLDLTDVFVFKSSKPGKTVFIMSFNPKSKKDSLTNYSSKGIYRFCIGADKNFRKGISPSFTFKNNKLQFYIANQAEPEISETGKFIGEGSINSILNFNNGIKIWSGTVLDLFQGNSGGLRIFKENIKDGKFDLSVFDLGEKGNVFNSLSSTVIVLEMPNEMLPKKIFYYGTTVIEESPNHWHRVNRISHVLFPHLYLLDQKKLVRYLNSNHQIDEDIRMAIFDNVYHYAKLSGYNKNPKQYANSVVDNIYPDILSYEVGTEAVYTVRKMNGRPLQADAMDVALAVLLGSKTPIDDKVAINLERFQYDFPYVIPIDNSYVMAKENSVDVKDVFEDKNGDSLKDGESDSLSWFVIGGLILCPILLFVTKRKNFNKNK